MQKLKFLNIFLAVLLVIFSSSCGKETPSIAPSDTSVSIQKSADVGKVWNGDDDDDWLVDARIVTQDEVPVGHVFAHLMTTNGELFTSLTNDEGLGSVEAIGAVFQSVSVSQDGIDLEIDSAVQNGNTINVKLK